MEPAHTLTTRPQVVRADSTSSSLNGSDDDGELWNRPPQRQSREGRPGPRVALRRLAEDSAWAKRPQDGDIYNSMELFFPEHDLDRPLVEEIQEGSVNPSTSTFKWVRGELIGKGTVGRVYLALNASTAECMAVKQVEIPDRHDNSPDHKRQSILVETLKAESEILKDLDHSNIVNYMGYEETPSHCNIFLEYVPGGSIGSIVRQYGKLSEDMTKFFTRQILDGLVYISTKGLVHRNLHSNNVLVEMNGTCKISDFGLARQVSDEKPCPFQGATFWMAPELISPHEKSSYSKVDIWSLGCLVLEMLSGQRPWAGENSFSAMYQLKVLPPVAEGVTLSDLAEDFIREKCLAM
ncbi:mitogen-activated protein kinase kinase kinase [Marasmius crinis-equi]|uniref:Mitogen-activated protein kinase kinase kinase n=1 Tax=Marasmius crinis-equi TaxID=585013 RepID=A0ABR3FU55_9AGAR